MDADLSEQVKRDADELLAKLLADHSALRGVTLVFDWNLPGDASDVMTIGLMKTNGGRVGATDLTRMMQRLGLFYQFLANNVLDICSHAMRAASQAGQPAEKSEKGAPWTDPGVKEEEA